ncbi:uncharacterized protein HGUI_03048 [Hanseniaspora guilliermondii]|uniref:glycerol kinase n=1 Tax=Hanseniaspora guilliermondii TaxID=56406 RepID=A0A1L0B2Z5_9ASCO|nr:uncharacterized protein HGUI_03048 [Hanseniaspora guilliermondii]
MSTIPNSKEPLILAIDVGTTSTRTMLFSKSSSIINKTQILYNKTPQDSNSVNLELCGKTDINNNIINCLDMLLKDLDHEKYKIVSIGIANMRESLITWDPHTLKPLSKCILWNDTRNKEIITQMRKSMSHEDLMYFRNKTGFNNISTYFSAGKLKWLLENDLKHLANSNRAINVGTVDSWILSNFTEERSFKTDVSNACRTGIFNGVSLSNDMKLMNIWNIPHTKFILNFPKIVSSSEFYGNFHIPTSHTDVIQRDRIMHWLRDVPIQGCLGDQSASLVGHLKFDPYETKMTYGTGCFILTNTGKDSNYDQNKENKLLNTVAYHFPYLNDGEITYALEGTIGQCGFLVQWLMNNIGLVDDLDALTRIFKSYNENKNVVNDDIIFVPALTGLYSPYWDDNSRGTIFGIDAKTEKRDLIIACIKGLCLQVGVILKEMFAAKKDKVLISIDGGLSQNHEFLKMQANFLDGNKYELERNVNHEATSFGAAIAAAFGTKNNSDRVMWRDIDDLKEHVNKHKETILKSKSLGDHKYSCNDDIDYLNDQYFKWDLAIRRSSIWLYEDIKSKL